MELQLHELLKYLPGGEVTPYGILLLLSVLGFKWLAFHEKQAAREFEEKQKVLADERLERKEALDREHGRESVHREATKAALADVRTALSDCEKDRKELRTELNSLQEDRDFLGTELQGIKRDIGSLSEDVHSLKAVVPAIIGEPVAAEPRPEPVPPTRPAAAAKLAKPSRSSRRTPPRNL
jgi:hypothetical protein